MRALAIRRRGLSLGGGTLDATNSTLGDVSGASATEITGLVLTQSLNTEDLAVNAYSSLLSTGNIEANGTLSIHGSVVSSGGDISMEGSNDSIILGDVTAFEGSVIIDGEISVQKKRP